MVLEKQARQFVQPREIAVPIELLWNFLALTILCRIIDIPVADKNLALSRDPPATMYVKSYFTNFFFGSSGIQNLLPRTKIKHGHVGGPSASPEYLASEYCSGSKDIGFVKNSGVHWSPTKVLSARGSRAKHIHSSLYEPIEPQAFVVDWAGGPGFPLGFDREHFARDDTIAVRNFRGCSVGAQRSVCERGAFPSCPGNPK